MSYAEFRPIYLRAAGKTHRVSDAPACWSIRLKKISPA